MTSNRALIVEDEKEDQKRIQTILDSRGIEYDTVDSALAAHARLKARDYLFVILDLDLGTGTDEGKFLLDTMLQEKIDKPTIIISHAGLLPETIALKGCYEFVKESIDKKHLHTLLSVFDKAVSQFPNEKRNPATITPLKRSLWPDLVPLLLAFVVILAVIAGVSRLVAPVVLGVVLIAALLAFLALSVLIWRRQGDLSESAFLRVIDSIMKSLPLLQRIAGGGRSKKRS